MGRAASAAEEVIHPGATPAAVAGDAMGRELRRGARLRRRFLRRAALNRRLSTSATVTRHRSTSRRHRRLGATPPPSPQPAARAAKRSGRIGVHRLRPVQCGCSPPCTLASMFPAALLSCPSRRLLAPAPCPPLHDAVHRPSLRHAAPPRRRPPSIPARSEVHLRRRPPVARERERKKDIWR